MGSFVSYFGFNALDTCVFPRVGEGAERDRALPLPDYDKVEPMPSEIPEGGYLRYPVNIEEEQHAKNLIRRVQKGMPVADALKVEGLLTKPPIGPPRGERLTIFYSDFEPDDVMAMTQLQQWKREQGLLDEVLHICYCDFIGKDYGTVWEMKMIVAGLLLGETNLLMLCGEGVTGLEKPEDADKQPHWKAKDIASDKRAEVIGKICERLQNFKGRVVELYILAPLKGNLIAILDELRRRNAWPLKRPDTTDMEWKVSLYSGSYNIKGYSPRDFDALKELNRYSVEPLVDMAKFTFFGGENSHQICESMGYWAMPDFSDRLHKVNKVLTAVLWLLNEEFNLGLIHPKNKSLFKGSELTADEKKRVEELCNVLADYGSFRFAKDLREDARLWPKVANYKKSTVSAFAHRAADGPLCDQLVFLHEFAQGAQPNADWVKVVKGKWVVDRNKGFSKVAQGEQAGSGDIQACQTVLTRPKDERPLQYLRQVSEYYIFGWLNSLQPVR